MNAPKKKSKKGQLNMLVTAVISFVVIGIAIAIGMSILAEVKTGVSNTAANSSIDDAMTGMGKFSDFLGIIALVIVAVVVIGYVYMLYRERA